MKKSCHMAPCFSFMNRANRSANYPELFCNSSVSISFDYKFSNIFDVIFRKRRTEMICSFWSVVSSFFFFILSIGKMVSNPKMLRIYTRSIVARMANLFFFLNYFLMMNLIRSSMRQYSTRIISRESNSSVSLIRFSSDPNPTFSKFRIIRMNRAVLVYFFKKPLDKGFGINKTFRSVFSRIHSMIDSSGLRLCDYFREPFYFAI